MGSKYSLICCCICLSYFYDIIDKNTNYHIVIFIFPVFFVNIGTISAYFRSSGKIAFPRHSLKVLAKKFQTFEFLIILTGISSVF